MCKVFTLTTGFMMTKTHNPDPTRQSSYIHATLVGHSEDNGVAVARRVKRN